MMPPALNHVSTRKVACKNPGEFPDDQHDPEWRIVRRRGVTLGYMWHRQPGFTPNALTVERWQLWHTWHAVTGDLEPITTGDWKTAYEAIVAHANRTLTT